MQYGANAEKKSNLLVLTFAFALASLLVRFGNDQNDQSFRVRVGVLHLSYIRLNKHHTYD